MRFPWVLEDTKGYKCYSPSLRRHFVCADVPFNETLPYFPSSSSPSDPSNYILTCVLSMYGSSMKRLQVYVRKKKTLLALFPVPPSSSPPDDSASQPVSSTSSPPINPDDLPIVLRKGTIPCWLSLGVYGEVPSECLGWPYEECISPWQSRQAYVAQGEKGQVCRLRKALYGPWFGKFSDAVQRFGELLSSTDNYQRLVGKLNYLTITRQVIAFAISVVSQFMSAPHSTHMEVALWIVRYLKVHPGRDLFYGVQGHLRVEAFPNVDWARSPSNRRSTTGAQLADMVYQTVVQTEIRVPM
ncbi:hypothetical protein Acr_00g0099490 [Actinidia rufa]|uniref:Mitochondrial protein n=1 Tax=Actinidia rufa TaxID=165716 RepID=A0A7J0DZI7_9ERIC|nr:hypothetical protein Acr_00g0099490 [Actinidia rufa]